METVLSSWQLWALLSAGFAALTAIFAKLGVAHLSPELATFFRTAVVLGLVASLVSVGRLWQPLDSISNDTYLYLLLSGLATGASWLCYFRALRLGDAAHVAPLDKLSVVLVAVFGTIFLGERLSGIGWIGVGLIAGGAALVAAS